MWLEKQTNLKQGFHVIIDVLNLIRNWAHSCQSVDPVMHRQQNAMHEHTQHKQMHTRK